MTIAHSRRLSARIPAGAVFTAAIFLSAALLFSIQPIVAKLALPRLGGSPAVWTTAMLFFQAMLLAGYIYAHLLATRLSARTQAIVHGLVLIAGAVFLPIAVPADWSYSAGAPITPQVLGLFALMVGLPFFCLAANAPLLQSWYALTGRHDAHDPYFLYAGSNVGSVLALLAYPLVVEPLAGAKTTSLLWAAGYGAFGLLLLGAAASVPAGARTAPRHTGQPVATGRWLRWVGLAALPSSMMLSTTQIIATDIGSFPLLWAIPLALYLLTFVLAFSRRLRPPTRPVRIGLLVSLVLAILMLAGTKVQSLGWWAFGLLIVTFTFTALVFHMRLHDDRPGPERLTGFYLAMSLGGVLGGVLNAAVAPLIFDDLIEAPLALALAGLVLSGAIRPGRDLLFAAAFLAITLAFWWLSGRGVLPGTLAFLATIALPGLLLIASAGRPVQFVALAAGLLVAGYVGDRAGVVQRSRSFFGIYSVHDRPAAGVRRLSHGTTIHGQQFLAQLGKRPEPLAYYHARGAMAQAVLAQGPAARIGVIGLGVGALACHAGPGQRWTFFEIDQEVDRIARDPGLFDFMDKCGRDMPTLLGDARLVLQADPGLIFDLLIIDAFSSDAIPIHLMTVEALGLYRARLAEGGLMVFHVTNRFFDLAPVLARAAERLGLKAAIRVRKAPGEQALARGEANSVVVALSAGERPFAGDPRWHDLEPSPGPAWTDDHASLLSVLSR